MMVEFTKKCKYKNRFPVLPYLGLIGMQPCFFLGNVLYSTFEIALILSNKAHLITLYNIFIS